MLKDQNKKKLFVGVILIVFAFLCTVIIFYFVINTHNQAVEEVGDLKEKVGVLSTEKELAQKKLTKLEEEAGGSIYIDKIVNKATTIYDEQEKARKEGRLWIDRNTDTYVVTLGILNGVKKGTRLSVYDGTKRIGYVRVETAMDVISYVYPTKYDTLKQFADEYYRVIFEE